MSDIDKDDYKREYLPLVHDSEEPEGGKVNPKVNSQSVIDNSNGNKYSEIRMGGAAGGEQTFYQKNKKIILIAGGILLLIGVVLAIVLPLTLGHHGGDDPIPPNPDVPVQPDPWQYQEYNPFYNDRSQQQITTFKASFVLKFNDSAFIDHNTTNVTSNLGINLHQVPKSLHAFMGYEPEEVTDDKKLNGTNYRPMNPRYVLNSTNNTWASALNLEIQMNNNQQVRVMLTNANSNQNETQRRSVNQDLFPRPKIEIEARLQQAGFVSNDTASFSFNFTDIYSKETLVTTTYRKMFVSDFFSEIGFVVPTQRCFGLGQRNGKFQLHQGTYTFNSRAREDSLPQEDNLGGKSGNHIHPFMLCQNAVKKDFFGMFFASNGPQVFEVVKFYNSTQMVVNYITIGGALEFYIFIRGTAQEIIQRYHNLIGNPMMPPYYALGVFHGSNSYNSWAKIKAVYDAYNGVTQESKQALEGVFVEDYNQQAHWTFTVNPQSYPNLGNEVDTIHSRNQKIIFGASVALAPDTSYAAYQNAKNGKCLIQSHASFGFDLELTGILDQSQVQYLDTFNKCYDTFLVASLPAFDRDVAHGMDGLIIKDAHAPNHVNGQIIVPGIHERSLLSEDPPKPEPSQIAVNEEQVGFYSPYQIYNDSAPRELSTYYLPFIPAYKYSGALDNMTISLNATLGDSLGGGRYSSLLVKNGLAASALKKTFNAVQTNIKKNEGRTLLFSDSTWSGSGAYSAALLTDQYRSWDDMGNVINQVIALSMYGLSATMVDTCGSLGPYDETLCTAWTQLATFMPMVRNYYNATYRDPTTGNRMKTIGSEPWNAKTDQAKLAFASIGNRLMLSRYIYTQMYLVHTQGGSLVKPLFFDFPHDDGAFLEWVQSTTFMLGDSLKVSPLLENKQDSYTAYFPQGVWVNIFQPSSIIIAPIGGINATLPVDPTQTNVHQRGGSIIPFLNNNKNLRNTRDVEKELRTSFKIVRDPNNNYAEGHLMIDDGMSPNLYSPEYMDIYQYQTYDKNFSHYLIRYSSDKTINFMLQNGDSNYMPNSSMSYQYLEQIDIMNAADLQNSDFACALDKDWTPINLTIYYTQSTKTLTIKPQVVGSLTFAQLMVVKFGDSSKDVSYCNGFFYTAIIDDEGQAETYVRYNLTSTQAPGVMEDLVAEFLLIDEFGSIDVEITTRSDFDSNKTKLYRPPQPEFYNLTNLYKKIPQKTLSQFLQVDTKNFGYRINNIQGDIVYKSDPLRLMITEFFVIDSGAFMTNKENGRPLMGIGERAGKAMLKNQNTVHTIWPYDAPNPIDDGKPPGKNMYGYQPVYYYQAETKDWMAVFDVGTYATDYFVNTDFDGQGTSRVTKVAVGGIIHKFFLQAPKIEEAIRKYQQLTGFQTVAPMWAFGWNQCKFGYYNESIWWGVYQNYTKFSIPLDTMWADIDYMDDYKVFTISSQTYATLPEKVQQIKLDGRYFVPIIDNAIAIRKDMGYTPFDDGVKQQVFIMKSDLSAPAAGAVWPGEAYYPDFFKSETVSWWQNNLKSFNAKIQFDGIWLDMNEPSSTCVGYCDQNDRPANAMKYKMPYYPGQRDLEIQALGLDTVHTGLKTPSGGYRTERDVRSLYAIKEAQATANYLQAGNKRSFVLSRSNAPGLQKYAFHWLADNWSKQEWMETSIDSIYEYNLFGIPMMGSDICGFNLDATPELCTRWHQLGSFYPFARNHKNSVWKQTEPFQYNFTVPDLDDGRTYTDLIRTALLYRYSLMRYIYSDFHQIGEYGGAFFKPLYYEFQDDSTTFDDASTQRNILLGNALKLSIQVQDPDQLSTEYQFPSSRWCQIIPYVDTSKCFDTRDDANNLRRLDSGIADYQVHLRGGRIVPYQNTTNINVSKSQDLMQQPTELLILANSENTIINLPTKTYNAFAAGFIYLDDGTSATDITRFDIEVQQNADLSYTIYFHNIRDMPIASRPASGKAATLSVVNFLWASETGFDKISSAFVTQIAGGDITLNAPVVTNQDTLRVELATQTPGQHWTFWDIASITLK